MIKPMYASVDTVTWVHIQIGNDFDQRCMEQNVEQIQFYDQDFVYISRDVNVYFQLKKVVMKSE